MPARKPKELPPQGHRIPAKTKTGRLMLRKGKAVLRYPSRSELKAQAKQRESRLKKAKELRAAWKSKHKGFFRIKGPFAQFFDEHASRKLLVDAHGRVLWGNKALRRLPNCSGKKARGIQYPAFKVGEHFGRYIIDYNMAKVTEAFLRAVRTGKRQMVPLRRTPREMREAGGQKQVVDFAVQPYFDKKTGALSFVAINWTDVTRTFEHATRTRGRLEERLRQVRRDVRRERDEIIVHMAMALEHTLRNPNVNIGMGADQISKMAAQLRQHPNEAAQILDGAGRIKAASNVVASVIERVTSNARALSLPFNPQPTSIQSLVGSFLRERPRPKAKTVREEAKARGIQIKTVGLAGLPSVQLQSGKIKHTLSVVVNNSVEAMEGTGRGGTITIRGKTAIGKRKRDIVEISVSDTGPGIGTKVAEEVMSGDIGTFKPGGSGVSLMTARNLARQHGGELRLQSSPNGTIVVISLPVKQSAR